MLYNASDRTESIILKISIKQKIHLKDYRQPRFTSLKVLWQTTMLLLFIFLRWDKRHATYLNDNDRDIWMSWTAPAMQMLHSKKSNLLNSMWSNKACLKQQNKKNWTTEIWRLGRFFWQEHLLSQSEQSAYQTNFKVYAVSANKVPHCANTRTTVSTQFNLLFIPSFDIFCYQTMNDCFA